MFRKSGDSPSAYLIVVYIFSLSYRSIESYCSNGDQMAITRCAQPLYDIGAFRTDSSAQTFSWDLFTQNEPSYFREVCDAFIRFDLCTHAYKEQCFHEEPMKSQYQTATSVLDYLCHEGYRDMLHHFQCIVGTLKDDSMLECQNQMLNDMHEIPMEMEDQRKEEEVCRTMQDYMMCMRPPFVKGCGLRAWAVVRDVVQRPTTLMIPECQVSASSSNPVHRAFYTSYFTSVLILGFPMFMRQY